MPVVLSGAPALYQSLQIGEPMDRFRKQFLGSVGAWRSKRNEFGSGYLLVIMLSVFLIGSLNWINQGGQ